MITQALPMKVPEYWFVAKPGVQAVARRIGGTPELVSAELLKRCCAGAMQLWLGEDEEGICGFALTEILIDEVSGGRTFHIYLLFLYRAASQELITEGRQAWEAFAKASDCRSITFATDTPEVVLLANKWWPGWELLPTLRRAVA